MFHLYLYLYVLAFVTSIHTDWRFFVILSNFMLPCTFLSVFLSNLIVYVQGVPRNTFHDFSSTCDNLTKKYFEQKLISFRLAIHKKIFFFDNCQGHLRFFKWHFMSLTR